MNLGISVYCTEDYTVEENKEYIRLASAYGIHHLFTSLHLPEVDYQQKLGELEELIQVSKACQMRITADISPATINLLNTYLANTRPFSSLGIDRVRVDYGFTLAQISSLLHREEQLEVEINASTVTEEELQELSRLGRAFSRVRAGHNFYPRPFTGLSYPFFIEKTSLLRRYGLQVNAFISLPRNKRGPLYEGLPTMEAHRTLPAVTAAKDLLYTQLIDTVYLGDAFATIEELQALSALDQEAIELDIHLHEGVSQQEREIIFSGVHTNRQDASEYLFRSAESRGYAQAGKLLPPKQSRERKKYSVTIDNQEFKRYSSELQICLVDLPSDPRVNVVGQIAEEDQILLSHLKPGSKVRFKEKNGVS